MSSRALAAGVIGALAGLAVFAALVVAGVVLYQRLFGGSSPLLLPIALVSGAIGAYSGWLLGLIVFSALREPEAQEREQPAEPTGGTGW